MNEIPPKCKPSYFHLVPFDNTEILDFEQAIPHPLLSLSLSLSPIVYISR